MTSVLPVLESASSEPLASTKKTGLTRWSDWLGVVAAIGCAIHCAAMPLIIAYLPTLGLSFLADEGFHQWMAVACFAIAVCAFIPGFRNHRRMAPIIIAGLGLTLISVTAFGSTDDCCATTEPKSPQALTTGAAATSETECADCCSPESEVASESCCSEDSSAVVDSQGPSSPSSWYGFLLPWLTPIGGFALVAAHLLNRRHCRCCSSAVLCDSTDLDKDSPSN